MRSILLDIIPRRFRRRSYLVSGTIFLRALLNFAGLALLIPVLLLILDSESMHTNPWLERLYQAGGFESDRAFALTVCGCIVALIAFKNLLNLFLLRYERRYIYDLYRCMSRRLYIEYHDRGLGFIKNTNSALLSRNVNFVCLAFVTGILVPLASITSESMLLALLFTALLFYNPTVAGLVLLVFIPTVWFYYSAVRKRLHRYGVQENEAQREKARTVVETFRGYADLEINDAFPSMLRRFDRAMDKIVTIQSRNMTVNALPSIFMEVGLAIGMALFVAVSLGTPGDEARVLFGVFAVAGLRLMPSVRNMMSGWSALKYNRYTIDILRDIDLNDEKPEPSAAQPPLPFEREIAVRDLSFRFDDERGDKEVLHGLTLTIRKGEHVGIRGASGAGKTTLFNLLLGFYTPTGGEITIDGEPLTAANRRRWQNAVGYVSQHVFLLDGTLLENIALGEEEEKIDRRRAEESLRAARLEDFVQSLSAGIDTPIGEAGNKLSGGREPHQSLMRFGLWIMFGIAISPEAIAIHSSTIECEGRAVLFLGESGTGKSTHTRLWQEHIPGARLLNDDSPIIRMYQGQATAFGSPWSGKTPCYRNISRPIAGIVRLSQAPANEITRLSILRAVGSLLPSCPPAFAYDSDLQDRICRTLSDILTQAPVWHLACLPDKAAAELSYATVLEGKQRA